MFGIGSIDVKPVIFKESLTKIPGVRVEYYVDGSRVQFHMWGDPEFPEGIDNGFREGLKQFPSDTVVVDFVPEVDSWYVEVNSLSVSPTDNLVEAIIKKMAKAVRSNG